MSDRSYIIRANTDGEIVTEPEYLTYLRSHGYHINGVHDVTHVESDSRDMEHMVCRIDTHELPFGHDDLDAVADEITIPVCSCEDYQYNQSVDVGEDSLRERSPGLCRHLTAAFREERARQDDQQNTLTE
jgi:hypothetical protein